MIAIPASFVNSYLDYLNKSLSLIFKKALTEHLQNSYLKGMVFYQITSLDSRISNPDQRMTQDIEKWA
jgi:ATP-binding cassette subfamily D (ALD) protein 3